MSKELGFNEEETLHKLKHYLPQQFPLKDFIHHNTLHAFQHEKFHAGLHHASEIFGYKTYLSLDEYRLFFKENKIRSDILKRIIIERKGAENSEHWHHILLKKTLDTSLHARIGKLRNEWKNTYKFNFAKYTQPVVFRLIGNYIDQGIAIKGFPVTNKSFLEAIRELEQNNLMGLFKSKRAKSLLFNPDCTIEMLLKVLVGDETLYEQYLFDQQFEHPGWSGMVSVLEDNPETLLDKRTVSLKDFILFELLLEINALEVKYKGNWSPLAFRVKDKYAKPFEKIDESELFETLALWQEAFEWSYYDHILTSLHAPQNTGTTTAEKTFYAIFCIDDRECSLRRYLEKIDKGCKTYATAGFFNVEFYFQPVGGKFHTKLCPAPVTPRYIIREEDKKNRRKQDIHFSKRTYGLMGGWLITQTVGLLSILRLLRDIFRPSFSAGMSYSFHHMGKESSLTIENKNSDDRINGLQVGFTVEEMADRIEGLLKSIGIVDDFPPIIYIVGHGSSSVNNTYYAGYDCGACSGRPGSVNARVASQMANHPGVREFLKKRGIDIPASTQFIGALQDTTRDEIEFYDEHILLPENKKHHLTNKLTFSTALTNNAKERARRFFLVDISKSAYKVHKQVKLRSQSLFEPRPEYNHATNALCIIGRREINGHLFLDRRSFLNSYDYRLDSGGEYLLNILKAVAPVCGGINLEYYFSRVDNQRLGAGSKLSHNVMGLVGVANGADGDLRTGLPKQMIEIHDPLRLLVVVEHFPETVLKVIRQEKATYEWFLNGWIHLVAVHPETRAFYHFKDEKFSPYIPTEHEIKSIENIDDIIEKERENIEPIILK